MAALRKLKWEVLPHPAYSPDLSPSDFHLFSPLKEFLSGHKFRDNDELITTVQNWIRTQPKNFFENGIRKLPERWRKCIAVEGDYVEK